VRSTDLWAFSPHLAAWAVAIALGVAYSLAVRRPAWRPTTRQVRQFFGGLALLLVATTWPLADLAASWSFLALVVQRLILILAVAPLLLLGVPEALAGRLTRPAWIDATVGYITRPVPAIVTVTVLGVATLTTPAVQAQASSAAARGLLDVVLVLTGMVLWAPVVGRPPGAHRLQSFGRAGYLVVQSIVPSFLAVVWIVALHPLYPAYAHQGRVLDMSPLVEQQLAGFTAKLGTIAVLWTVAFLSLNRAQQVTDQGGDPDPLLWSDVERQLQRAERRERRTMNAGFPLAPPKSGDEGPPPREPGG
jgi:cytochrome c oxidase assembly factor CtaG